MNNIKKIIISFFVITIGMLVGTLKVSAADVDYGAHYVCTYSNTDSKIVVDYNYGLVANVNGSTTFPSYTVSAKLYKNDKLIDGNYTIKRSSDSPLCQAYAYLSETEKTITIRDRTTYNGDEMFSINNESKVKSTPTVNIPTCIYKNDNYKFTVTPNTSSEFKNELDILIEKKKGDSWVTVSDQITFNAKVEISDYTNTCPQYVHYNKPGDIHSFTITNSSSKPSGWHDDELLGEYVDTSSAEAAINAIKGNVNYLINNINDIYNDSIVGSLEIKGSKPSLNDFSCSNVLSVTNYDELLNAVTTIKGKSAELKAYAEQLSNIKLSNGQLVGDILTTNNSNYYNIIAKYKEAVGAIDENSFAISNVLDCISSKIDQFVKNGSLTKEQAENLKKEISETSANIKSVQNTYQKLNINFTNAKNEFDCSELGDDLISWLKNVFMLIQILSVVIAVVLGMLDFARAVASGEDDAMKKAWKRFTRRLIVLAIIILLPFLIEFVLGLTDIPGLSNTNPLCK